MNASPQSVPRYYDSLDFPSLWKEFPPAPEFQDGVARMPAAELRALQERRFLAQVQRAWRIPFYQRHWGQAGLRPEHVRGLADLAAIPPFSVHDLRDALARNPPWGDFMGIDPDHDAPMPLVMQTSGGTTGLPRPMLYSPRDREVMNILTGRRLYMQGVRPYDLVQVMLSLGLSNGGFLAREGIWKYTGAVPVMTGTGAQTPTRRQIEIMQAWKTTQLVAFPAYLRHIGQLLRDEMKIDPRSLGIKGLIVHLGVDDRQELEALWGAPVYDTYGTNECGSLAADCGERSGMHIFEDAFVLEIADADTLAPVADGERGVVLQTTLFKHFAPLIRFNSNDISAMVPGMCRCGSTHRRLASIFGRADNMVKLRGTNIFPEAIGALVAEHPHANGEYLCVVEQEPATGRDDMTVTVEAERPERDGPGLKTDLAARFKEALGVKLAVDVVPVGALDPMTGLSTASKVRRLIDNRPKETK